MDATHIRRRYYAIVGLFNLSASLIWGINTLFLLEAGLTLFQAFVATAFFTAGMVVFEIPTGVVADTLGRRVSFLASLATLFVGTWAYIVLYWTHSSILWFSLASIVLGLGFTFFTGAVEAWLVDALDAVGSIGGKDDVFARGGQFQSLAMLVGTVGGGLLGQLDLGYPYLLRNVFLAILFVVAWRGMHDIGFTPRPFAWKHVGHEMRRVLDESLDNGWRKPSVRLLLLMSLLHMGFIIWGWYAWQPYFLGLLGRDLVWVAGVIAALVSLSMISGNQIARKVRVRRSTLLATASAAFAASMTMTGLTESFPWAVLSFLAGMVAFGVIVPTHQAALHASIHGTRATVVSFAGLLGSAGGIVSQVGLGYYGQEAGIGAAYLVGGVVLLLAVPLALGVRRHPAADGVS